MAGLLLVVLLVCGVLVAPAAYVLTEGPLVMLAPLPCTGCRPPAALPPHHLRALQRCYSCTHKCAAVSTGARRSRTRPLLRAHSRRVHEAALGAAAALAAAAMLCHMA